MATGASCRGSCWRMKCWTPLTPLVWPCTWRDMRTALNLVGTAASALPGLLAKWTPHSTTFWVAAGPVGMAFVATWLRLSSNKQLTWYRKSARQGKDIAHSQKVLAQRMADKVRGQIGQGGTVASHVAVGTIPAAARGSQDNPN